MKRAVLALCVGLAGVAHAERPATVAAACDRLRQLADALRAKDDSSASSDDLADVGVCHDGPRGTAWATRVRLVPRRTPEDDLATEGRVELVHLDAQGRERARELPSVWMGKLGRAQPAFVRSGPSSSRVLPLVVFDFDGDGEAEVFAGIEEAPEDAPTDHRAALYGFVDGRVVPSPLARGRRVDQMRDVDGDGRPDLVVSGPYRGSALGCSDDYARTYTPPLLFLRSLPGGAFSADDAVVRKATETICDGMGPFVLDAKISLSDDRNAAEVVCARLRGVPPDKVIEAIRAVYKARRTDDSTCDDPSTLVRWAKEKPPWSIARRAE